MSHEDDYYALLGVARTATPDEIKKAYYKCAVSFHPDKVTDEAHRADATARFQQLGHAYRVLSDKRLRDIYDQTGSIEADELGASSDRDWDAYWRELFPPVTEAAIASFEREYKGSAEELEDVKRAYVAGKGDVAYMLEHVYFAAADQEDRFRAMLTPLIERGELPAFRAFTHESKAKRAARQRKAQREAAEAAEMAVEVDVKTDASLTALIQQRSATRLDSLVASLEANTRSGMGDEGDEARAHVRHLLGFFLRTADALGRRHEGEVRRAVFFRPPDVAQTQRALARAEALLRRDYRVGKVPNRHGELCATYPAELLVLEAPLPRRRQQHGTHDSGHERSFAVDDARTLLVSHPDRSAADIAPPRASFAIDDDDDDDDDDDEALNNTAALKAQFDACRFARVRSRFVVPVLLVRNRNVCRSSTLAHEAEARAPCRASLAEARVPQAFLNLAHAQAKTLFYGQTEERKQSAPATAPVTPAAATAPQTPTQTVAAAPLPAPATTGMAAVPPAPAEKAKEWNADRLRGQDIALLGQLRVKYIYDLMVENRKIKYGLSVCSSEKADSFDRYIGAGLEIVAVPYPGCEFFKEFRDNKHCARKLRYDWSLPIVNAQLRVPGEITLHDVAWSDYRTWDLVSMTQNYLRLILRALEQPASDAHDGLQPGVLVHCISGWDRTPLFVSLLRISAWADDEAHWSLSPAELLYLTVAYDWMLFSHLLVDRMSRGEEVFQFCFYMLRFLEADEFCLHEEARAQHAPTPKSPTITVGADVDTPMQLEPSSTLIPPMFASAQSGSHELDELMSNNSMGNDDSIDLLSTTRKSTSAEVFAMDVAGSVVSNEMPRGPMPSLASSSGMPLRGTAAEYSIDQGDDADDAQRRRRAHRKSDSDIIDVADVGLEVAPETVSTEASGWLHWNGLQRWLAPAIGSPPKPEHKVSRGFVVGDDAPALPPRPSSAPQSQASTPAPGNVEPPAMRKSSEQELSEQLRDAKAEADELDPGAPQNSWQVIGSLDAVASPSIVNGGNEVVESNSRSFWPLAKSKSAGPSSPRQMASNGSRGVSAMSTLFWGATSAATTATSSTPATTDADETAALGSAAAPGKSSSVPSSPLRTAEPAPLARVSSFTLVDGSLIMPRERSGTGSTDGQTGSSVAGSAGLSKHAALARTISTCECCSDVPLDTLRTFKAQEPSTREAKLVRRRERLRALRTLFMDVYLSIQEDNAAASTTHGVWEWFSGAGRAAHHP